MAYKYKGRVTAYNREYQAKHADKIKATRAAQRKRQVALIEELRSVGCKDCGNLDKRVLDFHHPHEKGRGLRFLKNGTSSLDSIRKELAKCVVVCANCHRIRHATEGK